MRLWHRIRQGVFLFICGAAVSGCAGVGQGYKPSPQSVPGVLGTLESSVGQAVLVSPVPGYSDRAEVMAWQRSGGVWGTVYPVMKAVVGRNGFAPLDKKREGDGRTPSGVFRLERAFGYGRRADTGLAYTQVTQEDFWIDDPADAAYNLWVKGLPGAQSFERLRREDHLYRYAAVIEYNTAPVVPGKGSAIFLHVWRNVKKPTAGCVALSSKNVRRLLRWFDREQHPVILLGGQE